MEVRDASKQELMLFVNKAEVNKKSIMRNHAD